MSASTHIMNSRISLSLTKLPTYTKFGEETAEPLRRQGNVSTSQLLINLSTMKSAIVVSIEVEDLQEEERENVPHRKLVLILRQENCSI